MKESDCALRKFHKELLQLVIDHLVGKDIFTDDINEFYGSPVPKNIQGDCQIANIFRHATDIQEGLIDS